jgi:hypothetical protein
LDSGWVSFLDDWWVDFWGWYINLFDGFLTDIPWLLCWLSFFVLLFEEFFFFLYQPLPF